MGFLENLLKKEAKKMLSNVINTAKDEVIRTINSDPEAEYKTASSTTATSAQKSAPVATGTANSDENFCETEKELGERIAKVVANEWPGYELRKDIPAKEMDAAFGARKYSYGLYKDGTPKAMILVLDGRSLYCRKDTRLAHEACRDKGVFCMNLMMHLPNRYSYIAEQLRNNVSR
jgi:hypothetical protein